MGMLDSGRFSSIDTDLATIITNLATKAASATALSNATWTNARADKLDNLDAAVSSVAPLPPITNGLKGIPVSNANLIGTLSDIQGIPGVAVSTSSSGWQTVLSIPSNGGVVEYLQCRQTANASNRNWQLRLSIDGNVVYTSDTDLFQNGTTDNNKGICLVGLNSPTYDLLSFGRLVFTSSLLLEFQNNGGAGTIECTYNARYHLTS